MKEFTNIIQEIKLAKTSNTYKTSGDDWDDYFAICDEHILLDAGFTYSPLSMSILYGEDLTGLKWVAYLDDDWGLTAPIRFSILGDSGVKLGFSHLRYSKFKELFGT